MNTKIPSILLDSEQMACAVWEYWIAVLKTDEIDDSFPEWGEVDEEQRRTFIEAFRTQVVKHVRNYAEAVEFETSLDKAFDSVKPTPPMYTDKHLRGETKGSVALCYICAHIGVSRAGRVCSHCYFSHVNHMAPEREKNAGHQNS